MLGKETEKKQRDPKRQNRTRSLCKYLSCHTSKKFNAVLRNRLEKIKKKKPKNKTEPGSSVYLLQ